jgi:Tol biopolymer transport system component
MNRRRKMKTLPALSLAALAVLPLAIPSAARAGQIELVTRMPVASRPDTASGKSAAWQLSTDGRYLLFLSDAANLVPGQRDANGGPDVFLYDRVAGKTALVSHAAGSSVTAASTPVPQDYRLLRMTPDGRYVAYTANAGDLVVAGQSGPSRTGIFLYDRVTGTNVLVTHQAGSAVTPGNQFSGGDFRLADNGSVVFSSPASDLVSPATDANDTNDVFFWDRPSGKTTLISHAAGAPGTAANGYSDSPAVSGDGRWIAFTSSAVDLLPGTPFTSSAGCVFLHDRATGKILLVSHASSSASTPANGYSSYPVVSVGGNYVLFTSRASNLMAGQVDTESSSDLFLFERATGKITLLSHASSYPTIAASGESGFGLMTPDAQWIAFSSNAYNLVPGQKETARWNNSDVFLYERATGKTTLASRAVASPATAVDDDSLLYGLSADGRRISFGSRATNLLANGVDTNGVSDAFLFDRVTGRTTLVSAVSPGVPGNGASSGPVLSADGKWTAYSSEASNLAGGRRDTNGVADIFLYEQATAKTRPVTLHDPGLPTVTPLGSSFGWDVSADGRFMVFTSAATDLVPGEKDTNGSDDAYLYDRTLKKTTLVSRAAGSATTTGNGHTYDVRISPDGRFATYLSTSTNAVPGQVDANTGDPDAFDLFLFDRTTGATTLITHAAGSATRTGNHPSGLWPAMSDDATWIAYAGLASDLVDGQGNAPSPYDRNAFLYNRLTGQTTLLSHRSDSTKWPGNGESDVAGMSADGQVVLLYSWASNLLPTSTPDLNGGENVFVVDRRAGATTLISRTAGSAPRAAGGEAPRMSRDGRMIAFSSRSDEIVPGQVDDDSSDDLFLHDRQSGTTTLISHSALSPLAAAGSRGYTLSADGRWVAFFSEAPDLIAGQTNTREEGTNLFLFSRDSGAIRLVSHAAGSQTVTGDSWEMQAPSISADGRFIVYLSRATNMVAGLKTPAYPPLNAYVYDRTTGANALITRSAVFPDRCANADTVWPVVTASGNGVMLTSNASDLLAGDFTLDPYGQSFRDVFFYTLP